MRVFVIGRNYQPTEIDVPDAARRFTAWLADGTNLLLAEVIRTWLWQPPDAGGMGALAESDEDVMTLQAEVAMLWERASRDCGPGGQESR